MDKIKLYKRIYKTLQSIFDCDYSMSFQAKMSITSAVLFMEFPELIFCGFYTMCNKKYLEIGPYQGKVLACTKINIGQGVCGTVAKNKRTLLVDDVTTHSNYISCDPKTRSEVVVPVIKNDDLIAVIDIDSAIKGYFDQTDKNYLEKIAKILI